MSGKCWDFTFHPDEAGMFGPDVSFFAKFIKFLAPVRSGKFEFVSWKCQGILVSPKCMKPVCRSMLPIFHGPVITPCISMTICWRNVIPWILDPCDKKSDLKIQLGQCDLCFMVQ